MMSDETAVKLANLLAEYAADSVHQGISFSEVGDQTIRETVSDIVDATPDHLQAALNPLTQDLM